MPRPPPCPPPSSSSSSDNNTATTPTRAPAPHRSPEPAGRPSPSWPTPSTSAPTAAPPSSPTSATASRLRCGRPARDKGTELQARLREPAPSAGDADEAAKTIRVALRRAKQVIDAGEVLRVDPTPYGEHRATPTGALVDEATNRVDEEGLL